jgi:hypothetical protein
MVKEYISQVNESDIVQSPVDVKLDGVVVKVDIGLMEEFLSDAVKAKFDNLDQETLNITVECKHGDQHVRCTDRISFYKNPHDRAALARYIKKYGGDPQVGQTVKVDFNSKGFGSIVLD